ncbi:hypothetical protein F5884DRAFT_869718 [Xylogone sp. PMI_703]|nr:hypothetical protein F5884DRAFT_869718 [Xylogone sp. PMI_703]
MGFWSCSAGCLLGLAREMFARQEQSVVLVGDEMYVLGGILPFDGETYPTNNIVQKFNFITNTWEEVAPMPAALNHVNVAAVHGKIYYRGGLAVTEALGPAYWNASGASAVYDPVKDKWTVLPDVPAGRATGSAATMVVGDTVYLPGGLLHTNLTNDDEGTTAMFTSYNVVTKEWKVLPDLPAPRDHTGKGQLGDTLYILGGRLNGHWNVVDTGDPAVTANGVWPQMQAYDPIKDVWTKYEDMGTPVHGTAAVAYRGKVIVPGGGLATGGDPTQLVQSFTPRLKHYW